MVKRAVKTAEVGRSKAHMVAATIEQDILTGRLPFGQQLESENELVERFAVSRNTVRKGLDLLPNGGFEAAWKGGDGYLWLATGSGTNITAKGNPWLLGVA